MHNMADLIQHDIAIVSVFNLKQEANQAVCSHALDKVPPCLLESWCSFVTIYVDEVFIHADISLSAKLVT